MTTVDLLYLACNRLEFTRETFGALVRNTDWDLVRELVVYDDGSVDGTCEWLAEHVRDVGASVKFARTGFGSPVAAMSDFIAAARSPMLAKCDNDAMYPPGWLRQSLDVYRRHPELDLLGIEAMHPHDGSAGVERHYAPAEFMSGLGLYRRRSFDVSRPVALDKWFGLEEWQVAQGPALTRGWIVPALEVFLLDRCPFQPWVGLTEQYMARGWMRRWPKYDASCTLWRWRWPEVNR